MLRLLSYYVTWHRWMWRLMEMAQREMMLAPPLERFTYPVSLHVALDKDHLHTQAYFREKYTTGKSKLHLTHVQVSKQWRVKCHPWFRSSLTYEKVMERVQVGKYWYGLLTYKFWILFNVLRLRNSKREDFLNVRPNGRSGGMMEGLTDFLSAKTRAVLPVRVIKLDANHPVRITRFGEI